MSASIMHLPEPACERCGTTVVHCGDDLRCPSCEPFGPSDVDVETRVVIMILVATVLTIAGIVAICWMIP